MKLLDDGTHGGAPPGRCSRATAHRRRRAARLIARGYRLAGGGILPPGLHKADAEGDLGVEEEGCAQEPTEDHGPDEGEDLGRPVAEMEGRAAPASPEPGSELGAPERNDSGPLDTDSGTEDDDKLYLY